MSILFRSLKQTVFQKTTRSFHSSICFGDIKPFFLADIGEGITECEVVQWFVKPGTTVTEFDKICEVQSDKASVEISSRYTGNIVKLYYNQNEMAKVGAPLLDIEVEPSAEEVDSVVPENKSLNEPLKGTLDMSFWQAPSVRRLLDQYGLSITQINGSGKSGRVLKHDVLNYIKENLLTKKAVPVVDAQEKVKPVIEEPIIDNEYRTVPLTPIQKIMFKKMTHSLSIPHLGYKDEYELNSTLEYRAALNKHIINQPDTYSFKKISYLPIFIKSLSLCLNHYPIMNAMHQDTIVQYRDYHHIGIAMDTPQGLVVPNIKHVEKKTVFEVASEIHRLTQQAKKGTLSPLDLKGGTITISNIGSIGGTYANPVIVSPEMAIVAIGAAKKLPRFDRNTHQIEPKYIMPISWSADHRIIDGATIAQFSNMWKSFIENPALLSSQLQ